MDVEIHGARPAAVTNWIVKAVIGIVAWVMVDELSTIRSSVNEAKLIAQSTRESVGELKGQMGAWQTQMNSFSESLSKVSQRDDRQQEAITDLDHRVTRLEAHERRPP